MIDRQISELIDAQFPGFVREDAPLFVEFVKSYYRWLEQENQALGLSRKLMSVRDIDQTVDSFLTYFRTKYLQGLPGVDIADERFLVKHIADLYGSKGTERSIKLLFRSLYNQQAEVYLPGTDVFKPSHGTWVLQKYIELPPLESNKQFIGKQVKGQTTGATAFVDTVVRRFIGGRYLDIAYITGLVGSFRSGEQIDVITSTSTAQAPSMVGSLTTIDVVDGGANFEVGDVFTVHSAAGKQAKAQATEVTTETGVVRFTLVNGGWGYTLQSNVMVADRMLVLKGVTNTTPSNDIDLDFEWKEVIRQPKVRIDFSSSTNNDVLIAGASVFTYHPNSSIKSVGTVLGTVPSNTSAGFVDVYSVNGSFDPLDIVFVGSNVASLSVANVVNTEANGSVISSVTANGSMTIGLVNVAGVFSNSVHAPVRGATSNTVATVEIVGSGEGADFLITEIVNEEEIALNTDYLAANNIYGVPYMDLLISAADYGFPANNVPVENVDTVINDALSYTYKFVGSIGAIGGINSGQDYTIAPAVVVEEVDVAQLGLKDYQLRVINPTEPFIIGEIVYQGNTLFGAAKGIVSEVVSSNSSVALINVQRITSVSSFTAGSIIRGDASQTSGTIQDVYVLGGSSIQSITKATSGLNAHIRSEAQTANGAVRQLNVIDSGFGYKHNDVVTLNKEGSTYSVVGVANVHSHGTREGFYSSTRGFVSADKFIHDNDFYQEYSYQISSGLSFSQYKDVVKRVLHVAGTKLFGATKLALEVGAGADIKDGRRFIDITFATSTGPTNQLYDVESEDAIALSATAVEADLTELLVDAQYFTSVLYPPTPIDDILTFSATVAGAELKSLMITPLVDEMSVGANLVSANVEVTTAYQTVDAPLPVDQISVGAGLVSANVEVATAYQTVDAPLPIDQISVGAGLVSANVEVAIVYVETTPPTEEMAVGASLVSVELTT